MRGGRQCEPALALHVCGGVLLRERVQRGQRARGAHVCGDGGTDSEPDDSRADKRPDDFRSHGAAHGAAHHCCADEQPDDRLAVCAAHHEPDQPERGAHGDAHDSGAHVPRVRRWLARL